MKFFRQKNILPCLHLSIFKRLFNRPDEFAALQEFSDLTDGLLGLPFDGFLRIEGVVRRQNDIVRIHQILQRRAFPIFRMFAQLRAELRLRLIDVETDAAQTAAFHGFRDRRQRREFATGHIHQQRALFQAVETVDREISRVFRRQFHGHRHDVRPRRAIFITHVF